MSRWEVYEYDMRCGSHWKPLPYMLCKTFDEAMKNKLGKLQHRDYELDLDRFMLKYTATGLSQCVRIVYELNGPLIFFPFTKEMQFTPPEIDPGKSILHDFRPMNTSMMHWEPTLTACMIDGHSSPTSLSCVTKGSLEYNHVASTFSFEINTVFRLQNTSLLEKYNLKKKGMKQPVAEKLLWHGSSTLDGVKGIVNQGFDQMYSHDGVNAYGKGCYFAKSSEYSNEYACQAYSITDHKYVKLMFLVKILVGETIRGSKNMYPPPNIPGTHIPYNTAVDKKVDPSIFVTFSNDQALPLYLISYN